MCALNRTLSNSSKREHPSINPSTEGTLTRFGRDMVITAHQRGRGRERGRDDECGSEYTRTGESTCEEMETSWRRENACREYGYVNHEDDDDDEDVDEEEEEEEKKNGGCVCDADADAGGSEEKHVSM